MILTRISITAFFLIVLSFIVVFLSTQSIRLDESHSIRVASKPLSTVWRFIAQDIHVPLYYTILHFWMQVFGNNIISARIPSFIFYLLTLYVIYKFSCEFASKNVAYLSVFLFSLSPFVLWYSFEARMYTQFAFFSSLGTLYFLRMVRTNAENGKSGFLLSTILGVYTHYFYLFFLFSQGVYLIGFVISHINKEGSLSEGLAQNFKLLSSFLIFFILGLVSLVPWLVYVYIVGEAVNYDPLIPPPSSFNVFQTFSFFLFGFQSPNIQGLIVALWPLVVVLLFLIFTQRKKMKVKNLGYFEIVTILPIILFFAVSFIRPILLARYLIFTVPTLFFLLANVLLVFSRKVAVVIISFTFAIILGFLAYQNISAATPVKENYQEVSTYLNRNVNPSDIITVSAPFTIYPIEYSYKGPAKIDTIPPWDRFNQGPLPEFNHENLQKQIEDYKQIYSNLYVVFSYDQGYEAQIRSYLDSNYQMLHQQDFSPGLELRVYKLRYP